jgi:hypothetical protein
MNKLISLFVLSALSLLLSAQMAGAQAAPELGLTYAGESYSVKGASWMRVGGHIWDLTVTPLLPLVLCTSSLLLFRIFRRRKAGSSLVAAAIGWVGLLLPFAFIGYLRSMPGSGFPDSNPVIKALDKDGWWPIWGFTVVVYIAVICLLIRDAIMSRRHKRDEIGRISR